ncbi:hypothetical protein CP97_14843 [Aurantiacibacter atlanticus]|uniref:DUF2474 domain-containing protein n=1 Tax=Aurantiacibacter atlanticus TaxID=1648404 RepID=A0A161J4G2_9SPHN|nr:DUF2474 domain-containing protein [Aurantiacibacter atlanticus]ANC50529.1 hypothetical protein CP97_14843 [Aurantiacibacter atlanticus]MDF1835060.1 DUF2474 domain-containing protein [Alteraurantiacibacter sp. bin_em_oilr2.035]
MAHGRPSHDMDQPPLWKRLAWMAGIWAASVAVLGAVAFVIRSWLA